MENRLPTIPEYFKKYVNANIDLDIDNAIPCPFHHEEHGKSFTWSPTKKVFRCWGACHTGGDVINLHKLNYRFKTREEAKKSLYEMYQISDTPTFVRKEVEANPTEVRNRVAYANAISMAKTIDDYIELDYIMSMSPVDTARLETFVMVRKGKELSS